MERSNCIGGSDIAAIIGVSKYKTPLQLWAEKKGLLKTKLTEAMELGTELEEFVAQKFTKTTGIKVRREAKMLKHPKYPYLVGHIDRRVKGKNEILECKTTSAWKAKEWENGDIPEDYILQVNWYLGLKGWNKGYIACLIGGQKFVWQTINFDKELYEFCVKKAIEFYEEYLQKDMPPIAVADDNPILPEIYPDKNEEAQLPEELKEELDNLLERREELTVEIKKYEKEKGDVDARIKQIIGTSSAVYTDRWKVYWKESTKKSIDTQKLLEDGLYDNYTKISKFRALRVYKNKEE